MLHQIAMHRQTDRPISNDSRLLAGNNTSSLEHKVEEEEDKKKKFLLSVRS